MYQRNSYIRSRSSFSHTVAEWSEVGMFVIIFSILMITKSIGVMPNYSDGEKSGYITSLSKKGIMFKTWEGSMNMGGMRKEVDSEGIAHMVPNTFEFTVHDEKIVKELTSKMETGGFVTLLYDKWLVHPFSVDSPYIIKGIK